mgnify:FL=1
MIEVKVRSGRVYKVPLDNPEEARKLAEQIDKQKYGATETSVLGEVGRGVGAGLVGIVEGLATLGTQGYDYLVDENVTKQVTDFFEPYTPKTDSTTAMVTKYITQFGIPGMGTFSVLSKAGKMNKVSAAFGAAAADFAVATDDIEAINDMFLDTVPDEVMLERLEGSERAAFQLQDRLKLGAETATLLMTAPYVLGAGAKAISGTVGAAASIPGVGAGARAIQKGYRNMAKSMGKRDGIIGLASRGLLSKGALHSPQVKQAMMQSANLVHASNLIIEESFRPIVNTINKAAKKGKLTLENEKEIARSIQDYLRPMDKAKNANQPLVEAIEQGRTDLAQYAEDAMAMNKEVKALNQAFKDDPDLSKAWLKRSLARLKSGAPGKPSEYDIRMKAGATKNLLEKNLKTLNDHAKKIQASAMSTVQSFEKGRLARFTEGDLISSRLKTMRNTIDEQTSSYLKMGDDFRELGADPKALDALFVPPNLAEAMAGNIGLYGTRAFKSMRGIEYELTPAMREAAERELREKIATITTTDEASQALDNMLAGNFTGYDWDIPEILTATIRPGLLKGLTLDSFPAVRKALGEVTGFEQATAKEAMENTRLATSITGQKVSELAGRASAFQKIKILNDNAAQLGRDPFLVAAKAGTRLGSGDEQIINGVKMRYLDRKTFGAIGDHFVPSEMYDALAGTVKVWVETIPWGFRQAYKALLGAKGASQLAKTVYTPLTQVRNASGGVFFSTMNGNVGKAGQLSDSFIKAFGRLGIAPEKMVQELAEATELNVIQSGSPAFKEIETLMNLATPMYEQMSGRVSGKIGKGIGNLSRKAQNNVMAKTYIATDDGWKFYNWHFERDKLGKVIMAKNGANVPLPVTQVDNIVELQARGLLGPNGTVTSNQIRSLGDDFAEQFIKRESAEVVANNVPNYLRVPAFIRGLRLLPIGNFVAFPAEIIRTSGNVLGRAIQELASGHPELMRIGMKRLTGGLFTTAGLPGAITALGMNMTGTNQEQIDAYKRSFAAPWERAGTLVPIASDSDGNITQLYNFTYTNPYEYIQRPFRAVALSFNEGITKEEDLKKVAFNSFADGLTQFAEPFFAPAIATQAVMDVARGRTETGRVLWNEGDPEGYKWGSAFAHMIESFSPGIMPFEMKTSPGSKFPLYLSPEFKDFPRSVMTGTGLLGEDKKINRQGKPVDLAEGLVQAFTGFKVTRPQINRTLRYRGFEANDQIREASNLFNREARRRDKVEAQELVSAYLIANEARYRALRDAKLTVEDAKILGLADYEIIKELKAAKVANPEALLANTYIPFFPSGDVIADAIREDHDKVSNPVPLGEITELAAGQYGREFIPQENIKELQVPQPPAQVTPPTPPTPPQQAPQSMAEQVLREIEERKLTGIF